MADDVLSQMLGRPISTITGKPVPTAQERIAPGKEIIDFLSAMLPGIGDVRDIGEAVTGKDVWGEELSPGARLITALAAMLPGIPGAIRKAPKAARSLKGIKDIPLSQKGAKMAIKLKSGEIFAAHSTHGEIFDSIPKAKRNLVESTGYLDDGGKYVLSSSAEVAPLTKAHK